MFSQKPRLNKGFSLLEMTVVLAIVGIMTVIILLDLPRMKGGLSIDLVAQEIAIYIRGAQVYSRATKVSPVGYNSYGIHFAKNSAEFFLWADADNSIEGANVPYNQFFYLYNSSGDTKQEIYKLPSGFTVSKIICGNTELQHWLDIVFLLPDPEAIFVGYVNDGVNPSFNPCVNVLKSSVCLQSANQQQWRVIDVYNNGQIAVRKQENETECQSGFVTISTESPTPSPSVTPSTSPTPTPYPTP